MIRAVWLVVLAVALSSIGNLPEARAGTRLCNEEVRSIILVGVECDVTGTAKQEAIRPVLRPARGPYVQRKFEQYCTHDRVTDSDGGTCAPCPPGEGTRHSIQERTVRSDGTATGWSVTGFVCLTPEEAGAVAEQITPAMVLDAMRGLQWDKPVLSVQPPGGRTLVNAKTFAFAGDPGPRVQRVTLLGEQIDVEGTPTRWEWHWGDGAVDVTNHPGAPAPDGAVWHVFARASEGVRVRVDVTYAGRYRRPGGEWQPTPEGVTVRGDEQELSVHEAVVQLVR